MGLSNVFSLQIKPLLLCYSSLCLRIFCCSGDICRHQIDARDIHSDTNILCQFWVHSEKAWHHNITAFCIAIFVYEVRSQHILQIKKYSYSIVVLVGTTTSNVLLLFFSHYHDCWKLGEDTIKLFLFRLFGSKTRWHGIFQPTPIENQKFFLDSKENHSIWSRTTIFCKLFANFDDRKRRGRDYRSSAGIDVQLESSIAST